MCNFSFFLLFILTDRGSENEQKQHIFWNPPPVVQMCCKKTSLVAGFNSFKKYQSKWESSPNRDEHRKIFETTTQFSGFSQTLESILLRKTSSGVNSLKLAGDDAEISRFSWEIWESLQFIATPSRSKGLKSGPWLGENESQWLKFAENGWKQ